MIIKKYADTYSCWRGLVEELAYQRKREQMLSWGVCVAYPDIVNAQIKDALYDPGMHLGMSSYTKSRWTRFLRRYFRPDLYDWIHGAKAKLLKYPSRGFVASYNLNHNVDDEDGRVGHNYGGCLSSLQIRFNPRPTVILYSRACQLDKIGLLDLSLIHVVAKELGVEAVRGEWVISNAFISAISQVYYTNRFKLPMKGHFLRRRVETNRSRDHDTVTFGPLKRLIKRNMQLKEHGEIPRSCPISELSIKFEAAET